MTHVYDVVYSQAPLNPVICLMGVAILLKIRDLFLFIVRSYATGIYYYSVQLKTKLSMFMTNLVYS